MNGRSESPLERVFDLSDESVSELATPILPVRRKRIVIESLSSSDEGSSKTNGKPAQTVGLESDSENTADSDVIHRKAGKRRGRLVSDADELAHMSGDQRRVGSDEEERALAILKERSFNVKLDEEQLLQILRQTDFDPIRAERQIRQQHPTIPKNGLPTKTVPLKQSYPIYRNKTFDSDDEDVQPLVARMEKYRPGSSEYFKPKPQASTSAMLSDDDDDDAVQALPDRKKLPFANPFSKPSAMKIPTEPSEFIVKRKKTFTKKKRGKRRFDVYVSDDDEEEDSDDKDFINDDSEEELHDGDVSLSDEESVSQKKKKSKKSKPKTRRLKKPRFDEDELAHISDSEDEFEEREDILTSSSEEEEPLSPKKKKRKTGSGSAAQSRITGLRDRVVKFMNEATTCELCSIGGVSQKKADQIVGLRPFANYLDLRLKMESTKGLSTDLINDSLDAIKSRDVIQALMDECESLTAGITNEVQNLSEARQPDILNKDCELKQYQLIGLNWLVLMHEKQINAILADEMGLGKTIQVIALLAYLKEKKHNRGPHLIVVPASTLDNWDRELALWCRHLDVLVYHGSQKERQETRLKITSGEISFEILLTTYNMVFSEDDKRLFKKYKFQYIVFDEAHLLKNMKTNRYAQLMTIKSHRRLLLTGTPLQNNLLELMSLLIFTMPDFFCGKTEQVKAMFAFNNFTCKGDVNQSQDTVTYEQERVAHAKKIMRPFILRRLKADVLQQLPPKTVILKKCAMTPKQESLYRELIASYQEDIEHDRTIIEDVDVNDDSNEEVRELKMSDGSRKTSNTKKNMNAADLKARAGASMIMALRKAANHPLLVRHHYSDSKLLQMAKLMLKEPTHSDANPNYIFEDMQCYSDFELHELCLKFKSIARFKLPPNMILDSGKLRVLDELLPDLKKKQEKCLIFSQFCMTLDIMEIYMQIRGYKYLRLDGTTSVDDRLDLIDEFNGPDSDIFVFLLTTRAGGVGINLTAATTAIIHDIDFNPYNDKQAEDRCHRMGQKKEVTIYKFVTEDSIEEGILSIAERKLRLGDEMCVAGKASKGESKEDMKSLLKGVLGL